MMSAMMGRGDAAHDGSFITTYDCRIREFRQIVPDLLPLRDSLKLHDDDLMRRFLVSRKGNVQAAAEALRSYISWRAESRVDGILGETFPEPIAVASGTGYIGVDKKGYPVVYSRLRGGMVGDLLKHYTVEHYVRFHIYLMERSRERYRLARRNKVVTIIDLAEVSLWTLMNSTVTSAARQTFGLDQERYPEHARMIFVINAPTGFPTVWGTLKGFLDPRVQAKIHILGKNFLPHLLEYIDVRQIPPEFGGQGTPFVALGGDPRTYRCPQPPQRPPAAPVVPRCAQPSSSSSSATPPHWARNFFVGALRVCHPREPGGAAAICALGRWRSRGEPGGRGCTASPAATLTGGRHRRGRMGCRDSLFSAFQAAGCFCGVVVVYVCICLVCFGLRCCEERCLCESVWGKGARGRAPVRHDF
eukprot:RCo052687